jgi:hypothetical protein
MENIDLIVQTLQAERDGIRPEIQHLIDRLDPDSAWNKREVARQMAMVMALVPPTPWWQFWRA